jgi:hypothetical protein
MTEQGIETRLRRLSEATQALTPRADFADRVMHAIEQGDGPARLPDVTMLDQVAYSARHALSFAVSVAAMAVTVAWWVEPEEDDSFATSYASPTSVEIAFAVLPEVDP